jgi:hypothetical protein
MDRFAIVAPSGLATAQFIGIPALCFMLAVVLHWKVPRSPILLFIKAALLIVAGLQLRVYYYAQHSEVRFVDERMEFKVPSYYDRHVDLRHVDFKAVRHIDLNQVPDLQPKYRTNGIGLVGYRLGWHRLNNGRTAWVAITDPTRVVLIPQYEGPSVLVSVENPAAFTAYLLSLFDTSEPLEDGEGT